MHLLLAADAGTTQILVAVAAHGSLPFFPLSEEEVGPAEAVTGAARRRRCGPISEAKAMKANKHTRRAFSSAVATLGLASVAGIAGITSLEAQQKTVKIGITLPLTGADA